MKNRYEASYDPHNAKPLIVDTETHLAVGTAPYTGIATFLTEDGTLLATVTDYWKGVLPTNRLLKIEAVD